MTPQANQPAVTPAAREKQRRKAFLWWAGSGSALLHVAFGLVMWNLPPGAAPEQEKLLVVDLTQPTPVPTVAPKPTPVPTPKKVVQKQRRIVIPPHPKPLPKATPPKPVPTQPKPKPTVPKPVPTVAKPTQPPAPTPIPQPTRVPQMPKPNPTVGRSTPQVTPQPQATKPAEQTPGAKPKSAPRANSRQQWAKNESEDFNTRRSPEPASPSGNPGRSAAPDDQAPAANPASPASGPSGRRRGRTRSEDDSPATGPLGPGSPAPGEGEGNGGPGKPTARRFANASMPGGNEDFVPGRSGGGLPAGEGSGGGRRGNDAESAGGGGAGGGGGGRGRGGRNGRGQGGGGGDDPFGSYGGGGNGGSGNAGNGRGGGNGNGPGGPRRLARAGGGEGGGEGPGGNDFGRGGGPGGLGTGGNGNDANGNGPGGRGTGDDTAGAGGGRRGRTTRGRDASEQEGEDDIGRGIWNGFKIRYFQDTADHPDTPDATFGPGNPIDWQTFTKLITTVTRPTMNFDWNSTPPAPGMKNTFWSMRATGKIFVPKDDEYQFYFDELDDAGSLSLDGKEIIRVWKVQKSSPSSGKMKLSRGAHTLDIEYVQGPATAASIKLSWKSTSFPKEVVGVYKGPN